MKLSKVELGVMSHDMCSSGTCTAETLATVTDQQQLDFYVSDVQHTCNSMG